MKLEYKPDFEDAAKRWDAFWKGENKRPMVNITVPKENTAPINPPLYLAGIHGDMEPVIGQILAWAETHDFVGEAIPFYYLEFGPDTFAAYLGAELKFLPGQTDTSWSVPFVEDWDDTELRFKPESIWWKKTEEFASQIRARCDGKLLIAPACLSANLDALVSVRGAENLLMDLITSPDKVKRALSQVCDAHDAVLAAFSELFSFDTYGSVNLEGFYTLGKQSRPQCDASCMISPEMFREFVQPALCREGAAADAMVYHLDGPGAIKHLEALCEIDDLDLITWVPGAGNTHLDWEWLYDRIIGLGKGYGRYQTDHAAIKRFCREKDWRRVCFSTTASSKTEAEDLIAEIERICQ
jgi:hypothetical protein